MRTPVSPPSGGFPEYGYTRQLPESVPNRVMATRISGVLPYSLLDQGYELLKVEPVVLSIDPYVLYGPWGEVVAVWEVMPNLGTLYDFV